MQRTIRIFLVIGLLCVMRVEPTQAQDQKTLKPCTLILGANADESTGKSEAALCGTFAVPEDWSTPSGAKLDIHVTVLPAREKTSAPPIFHLEGGPGASASLQYKHIWFTAYNDLRRDHDLVLIDQRGTGDSASLQCSEVQGNALSDLGKGGDTGSTADEVAKLQACLKRVMSGPKPLDPAHFTSAALADDTNAIRQALGYDKIDIYGSSYGTWLAQVYAQRHGESVHAMVLDGTVGPWNHAFLRAGVDADAALAKAFDLCKQDSTCNTKYPNLPDRLKKVLATLEKNSASSTGLGVLTKKSYPVVMTSDRLLQALQALVSNGSTIGSLPEAIVQAEQNNFTTLAAVLVSQAEQEGDNSVGLYWSIVCAENVAFYTEEQLKQAATGGEFGSFKSYVEGLTAICKAWRSAELSAEDVAAPRSKVPILLLAGDFDPITPPAFAQETASRFANSTVATFAYQGHGVMPFSKCGQNLTRTFFADPTKTLDIACAANDPKPVFAGTYALPKLTDYTDSASGQKVKIPQGWTQQASKGDSPMLFFDSSDGQTLGIAILRGDKAKIDPESLISAQYTNVFRQINYSQASITINQYVVDTPDQVYTAVLLVLPPQLNGAMRVLWYAAPPNMFSAAFEAVLLVMMAPLMTM